MNYTELKKRALESCFSNLNERQKEAVFRVNGNLLVDAGAGTGKTGLLIERIFNMVMFGNAYHDSSERVLSSADSAFLEQFPDLEKNKENIARLSDIIAVDKAAPESILAITFSKKAATELHSRIEKRLGSAARDITAATFHSVCWRILGNLTPDEMDFLGFTGSLELDTDNEDLREIAASAVKAVLAEREKNGDAVRRTISPAGIISRISRCKADMISPEDIERDPDDDFDFKAVYSAYQKIMLANNKLDYDDQIYYVVKLLEGIPGFREYFRKVYRYIMVDEYQDTNVAQYMLVSLLAGTDGNLCVVGDEYQSIYKFRGARIDNIRFFKENFDNCTEIRLEQNYRSTQNILDFADKIIRHSNEYREKPPLHSNTEKGCEVEINKYPTETAEADAIASEIADAHENGARYSDHALLYRNNYVSQAFEAALLCRGIPYSIKRGDSAFGAFGVRFCERRVIRHIMSYLSLADDPNDLNRAELLSEYRAGGSEERRKKAENQFKPDEELLNELISDKNELNIKELIEKIIDDTHYFEPIGNKSGNGNDNKDKDKEKEKYVVRIFTDAVGSVYNNSANTDLPVFLRRFASVKSDGGGSENDTVSLMTAHSSKGLEFPVVYLVEACRDFFPFKGSDGANDENEECRLMYVAVTRAKRRLVVSYAEIRRVFDNWKHQYASKFLLDVSGDFVRTNDLLQFFWADRLLK